MGRAARGAVLALLVVLGSGACLPARVFWIEPDTGPAAPAQGNSDRSLAVVFEVTQGGATLIWASDRYSDRVLERLRHSGEFSSVRGGSVPADARLEFRMDVDPPGLTLREQLQRQGARITFGWIPDALDTSYAISLSYLDRSGRRAQQQSSRALRRRAGRLSPRVPIARPLGSETDAFTQLLEQTVDEFVLQLRREGVL